MKINKRLAIILSFAVGTLMFASTAMAEVASKSGYDQLKDSLKYTGNSLSSKLSSYTLDMSFVIKDNNTVVSSTNVLDKCDLSKNAKEQTSKYTTTLETNGTKESYYYNDKNSSISHDSDEDFYRVIELKDSKDKKIFTNPFEEKQAGDLEKISDALVGNLKDSVVVTQNADGSKKLSGSLTEAQIPALVNAVASFEFKNQFRMYNPNETTSTRSKMSKITKDIFVKEVKGTMDVNKDGLMQNILFTGTLSGKDEQGTEHTLTFELLAKVTNINSTTVTKPDLSDKKVEKQVQKDDNKLSNAKAYIGKYKSDLVIEKDNKFVKIGERIITITSIDEDSVIGNCHEEYIKGYESYGNSKNDFNFDGKFDKQAHRDASFNYTNSSEKTVKGHIFINPNSSSINFDIDGQRSNGSILFDNNFNRMFD
ncbi:hypothetical protein [Clostridium sp. JS66]|uniref:hypothetical protein n=1 Tax=Clostridium sp. JS66 TaxID=3064705 RepID=UPI00298D8C31|nr:hypothetical protein [Clostridium sp. JS66]WPC42424.1 hypothetical protein Q6H37_02880 [Clostridium sp. JS66]